MSVEVTWWGASCLEIASGGRRLVVDPLATLAEPRFDCVCVTSEDHDHLDPAALRAAVAAGSDRFLLPRACAELDRISAPIDPAARALDFLDPVDVSFLAPHRRHDPEAPRGLPLEVAGFRIETWESSVREPPSIIERWTRLRSEDEPHWPSDEGPIEPGGESAPLGFLVTDLATGIAVFHPGDLQEVYDVHRQLRGRVELMCLPLPATEGVAISILDAVRPRTVLPIHYRPGRGAGEGPAGRTASVDPESGLPVAGASPDAYRAELRSLIAAGWFPSPADPAAVLADFRPRVEELGSRLVVTAPGLPLSL